MKKNRIFAKACLFVLVFLVSIVSCEIGLGSAVDTQAPSVSISYPPSLSVIRDSFVFAGNWSDDRSIESIFVEVYQIKDDQKTVVFKEEADTVEQNKDDLQRKQAEGTWSITLNKYDGNNPEWYNGWQFCDGDYEIQVYAKDNAKQVSSVASRTISIDNTAPVLLLTNPTSAGSDASPASFGQIVQLTGYFYEFTGKISNLTVSFYDESGNALLDSNFTNITSMSDSSPLIVARYFSTQEERAENSQIYNNYAKLLGENQIELFDQGQNVENKKIYFTVTASDNAREYKTIGDSGAGEGNLTKHFYRGTTSMQNLVSGDGGIENFSLTDFAQYMNGTSNKYVGYSQKIKDTANAARSASVTNVTTSSVADYISNNDSRNGDPVYLTFVLNPKNNPLYTFGGYEIKQNGDENYSTNGYKFVYAGTSVPLSISVGADNKNIATHTVSVYRIDKKAINDANASIVVNEDFFENENNYRNGYFDLMHTWDSEVVERFEDWSIDISTRSTETDPDANTASLSKQFEIKELLADHEYDFYVVGKDIAGSSIIATNTRGYGFCGRVTENAPQINVTSTEFVQNSIVNEALFKGTEANGSSGAQNKVLYMSGTIQSDKVLIEDIPADSKFGFGYKLTITSSSTNATPVVVETTIPRVTSLPAGTDRTSNYCYLTNDSSPYIYNWRFTTAEFADNNTVKAFITNPDAYELSLELVAYNGENSKTSITRTFTLDTQPPVPEWTKMSVQVKNEGTAKSYFINPNKSLTINGIVTDNLSPAKNCKTKIELVAIKSTKSNGVITLTEIDSATGGSTKWHYVSPPTNNNWEFTIPAETIADTYYGAYLYIYSQDVAGNINEYNDVNLPITLVFDKTPPKAVHKIDSKQKDAVLRLGNNDNDDITPANAASFKTDNIPLTWDSYKPDGTTSVTGIDTEVGKKYSSTSYGNSETIKIRGLFEESGSGIDLIYYKVFYEQPDSTNNLATNFLTNYESQANGWFSVTDPVTKRVFYNKDNDHNFDGTLTATGEVINATTGEPETKTLNYIYQDYNYYTTIPGLTNANNYLVLVAVDKVGNAALDEETVDGVKYDNYQLNVDNSVPVVTSAAKFEDTQFFKSDDDNATVTIYGKVTDNASGIRSLVVKVNGKEITSKDDTYGTITLIDSGVVPAEFAADYGSEVLSSTNALWKAVIKNTAFAGVVTGKSVSVQITAIDDAGSGNSETYSVANVTIDKKAPTVTIKDPKENAEVNKTITVSFVNSDGNGSGIDTTTKPEIYYSQKASKPGLETADFTDDETTGWKKLSYIPTYSEEEDSWTVDIDTTKNIFEDNKNLYITISSKDEVGNIGYSDAHTLRINQDSDRPVIKLSNFTIIENNQLMNSNVPVWHSRSEIYGTVSDDDGDVLSVKAISKKLTENAPSETDWNSNSVKELYESGSWSLTVNDGPQKIYFRVKDAKGNVFVSNSTSTTRDEDAEKEYGPKLIDSKGNKTGYRADNTVSPAVDETPDDIIYTRVDTFEPTLVHLYYYAGSTKVDDISTNTNIEWTKVQTGIISEKFGGTKKKYLYIKYKATDTNGIYSITPKIEDTASENNQDDIEPIDNPLNITLDAEAGECKEFIACFNLNDSEKEDYTTIGALTSGTKNLSINIKDNASINANGITTECKIQVDNNAPEISFSNYTSGAQVYGSSAVTLRGGTADENIVTKLEYALTKTNSVPSTGWKVITKEEDHIKDSYTSALGWQIVFDGKLTQVDTSSFHDELLKKAVFSLYGITGESAQNEYATTSPVYVWIKATDEFGNCSTNSIKADQSDRFYFDVIPNGDIPSVEISYPSNGSSAGGTIRITGTTDIQDTSSHVSEVYIQIDPSYNGTFDNSGWATELGDLLTAKGVTSYKISDSSEGVPSSIGKGIKVQGSSKTSWHLTINANKELNDAIEKDANNKDIFRTIAIRAYAVSNTGKITESLTHVCSIDPKAPTFGQTRELRFVQYSDAALTQESASRKFENGIYLTGQWYLVGSVEDDSGIYQITLGGTNIVANGSIPAAGEGKVSSWTKTNTELNIEVTNFDLKIPIGNATPGEFGEIKYELSATDASTDNSTGNLEFTIYYDNEAPEFEATTGNGNPFTDAEGNAIAANRVIRQSNGIYTVAGTFAEPSRGGNNQSGFSRIAMYFTRTRNGKLCLLDPMVDDGANGDANFVDLTGFKYTKGLYWQTANATLANGNQLTIKDDAMPLNVRAGGLCMVDNVIYRIKSINAGTKVITLEGTLTDITTQKPVYFALAQIIDNQIEESLDKSDGHITGDDGDGMIECVRSDGTWFARLDSSNMLDGNINMCFVAFDAAGNMTESSMEQKILNNAPRIAGLKFGADKDLDGSVTGDEQITSTKVYKNVQLSTSSSGNDKFNGQDADGNWITEYNPFYDENEYLVVKGALWLLPEVVGGNIGLGWQYSYTKQLENSTTTASTAVQEYENVGHSNNGSVRTDEHEDGSTPDDLSINISLKDFLTNNIAEGRQNLVFTIWDKTDGSTLGNANTGSACATITLPVKVMIKDNEDPVVNINPLYWDNKTKNSLYMNNPELGHIELKNDLPSGEGKFNDGGSGVHDRDDKVSGMVTFEGTVTDNVVVNKIEAIITGYNSEKAFTIAERGSTGWTSTNLNASLTEGESPAEWSFEIAKDEDGKDKDTYDVEGKNTVEFKFHFNTEKISTVAASNVTVSFKAYDKGSPSLSDDDEPEVEYNTPKSSTGNYRVDVVPYITKITTALSALKNNNPSVYARTAQGHYSVASNETKIKFEGFNLGGDVKFAKEGGSVTVAYNADGIAIPADAKSGNVSIEVSGIESLNNLNGNDSKGSYIGSVNLTANPTGDKDIYSQYYYNRQPNGDNNNLLTDDVVFDIWQINSNVAQAQGSAYITEPIMKINPVSGMLNFAFNSGPGNFTMANGTSTSYTTWLGNLARMSTAGFTVDENGVTHGITVGLDTNPSSGSAGRMQYVTSKWGQALSDARDGGKLGTQGNYEGTQSSRFETIGAPKGTYNGVSYSEYIFMEDRFASPSIVTSIHTEGEGESAVEHTYVFLAYYDDINGQIRFRYGDLNNTTNHTIGRSFGGFQDAWVYGWGKSGDGNHKSFNTNTRPQDYSVIAASGVSGNYLSIDLIKGDSVDEDIIVATWQDSTSEKWYYAYKKKPCTDNDLGAAVPQNATSNDGYWSDPILLASGAGEDCHISVDPRGGVHIAAYDTDGANLLYAYLANYNDTTAQVVTVDSYAFTGEHLTIDSALSADGNYVVPLIGYYMGSAKKPKIAKLEKVISATNGSGTIPSGVDNNDACTGKWETAIIPTDSKYSDNYAYSHVNVAVWKDADGKIKNSTRPDEGTENVDTWIGDNKKVSDETKGYFWGNGTNNPVLGYAIRVGTRGYIETAQMK